RGDRPGDALRGEWDVESCSDGSCRLGITGAWMSVCHTSRPTHASTHVQHRLLKDRNVVLRRRPVVEGGTDGGAPVPDGSGDEGTAGGLEPGRRGAVVVVVLGVGERRIDESEADDVEGRWSDKLQTGRGFDPGSEGGGVGTAAFDDFAVAGAA